MQNTIEKEINMEERKSIMLGIMDIVDDFCRLNGLHYTLSGGSMLGAIRHNGFIPWDDDIDICMPRNDYEIFASSFNPKNTCSNIELESLADNNQFYLPYAKVVDKRTVLIEDGDWSNPMNVGIDVFPLDNCYDSFADSCKYIDSFKKYYWLKNFKLIKFSKKRKIWKNAALFICKVLTIGISRNKIAKSISKKAKSRSNISSAYISEIVNNAYGYKEIFPTDWFEEYEDVLFENRHYLVSKKYKEILAQVFGNYMELPPIEKRVNHNAISFWG